MRRYIKAIRNENAGRPPTYNIDIIKVSELRGIGAKWTAIAVHIGVSNSCREKMLIREREKDALRNQQHP